MMSIGFVVKRSENIILTVNVGVKGAVCSFKENQQTLFVFTTEPAERNKTTIFSFTEF